MWAIYLQFDEIADGRPVNILNMSDEFTRDAPSHKRSLLNHPAGTMAVFDQIHELRGAPHLLCVIDRPRFITDTLHNLCQEQHIQASYSESGL